MTMPAEPCRAQAAFENVEITVPWMPPPPPPKKMTTSLSEASAAAT